MQIFKTNDSKSFYYNNRKYVTNFIVQKVGNTHIAIYNAYDTKLQLMPATHYSEVMVNETIFSSQRALMDVLSPVVFTKVDASTIQNNQAVYILGGLLAGGGAITTAEVSTWVNNSEYPFVISDIQSPVIFEFLRTEGESTKKYLFLFTLGKGVWGAAGYLPVFPSYFKLLSVTTLTIDDITDNSDSNFIEHLGEIPDGDFLQVANSSEWDLPK